MDFKIPPWKHQLEAISRARPLSEYALFFEMGAGKTGTSINILREKFAAQGRVLKTLILCPPIVVPNWRDEWLKHSHLEPGDITLLTGSGKDRLKKFREAAWGGPWKQGIQDNPAIFVTNYESLLMEDLFLDMLRWQPEVLLLDESHKCKDAKAKRTKHAIKLSQQVGANKGYRYILSGSPVLNSPLDLFAQYLILDGGDTFGKNFFAFRGKYFYDKNAGMPQGKHFPDWKIRPGALDEINALIYRKGMRVLKTDCMDLPPMVQETIKVPMTRDQQRLYLEMKQDFITFMGDKAVTATMALTKALRLMQIASGYVQTSEDEALEIEDTPKQAALKELLAELTPGHKVLVWSVWKKNYDQIRRVCESLGLGYVEVHGGISPAQKYKNVDRFNTDDSVRVFIGHPGSGGIGINLVAASYSIFYSRTFSLEHSLQAEARNYRGGSEIHAKITRIDLVCENTIDELVTKALASKIEISDTVLRDLSLEL